MICPSSPLASVFAALLLISFSATQAKEPEKDSPQAAVEAKVATLWKGKTSDSAMVQAAVDSAELWDAEMNRAYAELLKELPAEAKVALKSSQKAWLVHRDQEYALYAKVYGSLGGTMYKLIHADSRFTFVRERALDLAKLLAMHRQGRD